MARVHSVTDDILYWCFFRSGRADPHIVSSCACSVWNDTEKDSADTHNREVKGPIVDIRIGLKKNSWRWCKSRTGDVIGDAHFHRVFPQIVTFLKNPISA